MPRVAAPYAHRRGLMRRDLLADPHLLAHVRAPARANLPGCCPPRGNYRAGPVRFQSRLRVDTTAVVVDGIGCRSVIGEAAATEDCLAIPAR